jgi:hypothetical protein
MRRASGADLIHILSIPISGPKAYFKTENCGSTFSILLALTHAGGLGTSGELDQFTAQFVILVVVNNYPQTLLLRFKRNGNRKGHT